MVNLQANTPSARMGDQAVTQQPEAAEAFGGMAVGQDKERRRGTRCDKSFLSRQQEETDSVNVKGL